MGHYRGWGRECCRGRGRGLGRGHVIGGGDIIGGGEGTSQVKNLAKKQQDLIRIDSFS